MQHNEEYVLKALEEGGLITRPQIDGARSLLNGEPGIVDVLINDGVVSDVDVSRTLAAQAHMDWIDISSMVSARQARWLSRAAFAGFARGIRALG